MHILISHLLQIEEDDKRVKGDISIAMKWRLHRRVSVTYDLRLALRQRHRRPHINIHNNDVGEDIHCPAVCNPSRAFNRDRACGPGHYGNSRGARGNGDSCPPF